MFYFVNSNTSYFCNPFKHCFRCLLWTIILFILDSCKAIPYVILPEYNNKNIKNKELLIVEIDSSDFSTDVAIFGEDKFKKEYLPVFQKSFENAIVHTAIFSKVTTNSLINPTLLKQQEFTLPTEDKIILLIPETEKIIIDNDGYIPDYLLIISKLELAVTWIEIPFGPYEEGYRQTVHYAIWDNHRAKLVCYGKSLVSRQLFSLPIDPITTGYFVGQNVRIIIANSPFKK